MTIHPTRLALYRQYQEHAHTLTNHGRALTHTESMQLLDALDDMLTDYTNEHRGN